MLLSYYDGSRMSVDGISMCLRKESRGTLCMRSVRLVAGDFVAMLANGQPAIAGAYPIAAFRRPIRYLLNN